MIRVEALDHKKRFRAIGIFDDTDQKNIQNLTEKNENSFLRIRKVSGKKRKTIWTNYEE